MKKCPRCHQSIRRGLDIFLSSIKNDTSQERRDFDHVLWSKAWVLHCVLMLFRAVKYYLADTIYDTYESEMPEDKQELIDEIVNTAKVISVIYVCLGLVLDILCCKWRWLARLFFHMEMLHCCLYYVIPNEACQDSDNVFLFLPFFYSICFFCDVKSGLFTLIVTMFAGNIFLRNILLEEELSQRVNRFFANTLFIVLLLLIMACAVTYVTNLHKKFRQQVSEYFNLINRMREGVLLLTLDAAGAR